MGTYKPIFNEFISIIALHFFYVKANKAYNLLPNVRRPLETTGKMLTVDVNDVKLYYIEYRWKVMKSTNSEGSLQLRKQIKVTRIHVRWVERLFQDFPLLPSQKESGIICDVTTLSCNTIRKLFCNERGRLYCIAGRRWCCKNRQ